MFFAETFKQILYVDGASLTLLSSTKETGRNAQEICLNASGNISSFGAYYIPYLKEVLLESYASKGMQNKCELPFRNVEVFNLLQLI